MSVTRGTLASYRSAAHGFGGSDVAVSQLGLSNAVLQDPGPTTTMSTGAYTFTVLSADGVYTTDGTSVVAKAGSGVATVTIAGNITGAASGTANMSIELNVSGGSPVSYPFQVNTSIGLPVAFSYTVVIKVQNETGITFECPADTYSNMNFSVVNAVI